MYLYFYAFARPSVQASIAVAPYGVVWAELIHGCERIMSFSAVVSIVCTSVTASSSSHETASVCWAPRSWYLLAQNQCTTQTTQSQDTNDKLHVR